MDLTNNINTNKNPDTETESPPKIILPKNKKSQSFYTSSSFVPPLQMVVSYKECLKNHAASLGGHALDGCGEFMPSPTASSNDPASLNCAACGCHRNFHRRDPYEPNAAATHRLPPAATASHSTDPSTVPSPDTNTNSPQHHQPVTSPTPCSYYSSAPHMLLALSTGFSAPPDDGDDNHPRHHHYPQHQPPFNQVLAANSSDNGKKRSRTKFTQEQKEKMLSFAERLGWKMNRAEEKLTQDFCSEVGVSRRVFKVWMHNNKNASGRKDQRSINNKNINDIVNGCSRVSFDVNGNSKNHNDGNGNGSVAVSPKCEE